MTTHLKISEKPGIDLHTKCIETSASTIVINQLEDSEKNLLLVINHPYLVTYLDFTHAPDYQIELFDEEDKLMEIKWAINNAAPFIISTRYKNILLTNLKTK